MEYSFQDTDTELNIIMGTGAKIFPLLLYLLRTGSLKTKTLH